MEVYLFLIGLIILSVPLKAFSQRLYLFLNLFCIWFVMAFRGVSVGRDTITYEGLFPVLANQNNSGGIWSALTLGQGRFEIGFILYNKILYSISHNPQILVITTSLIITVTLGVFIDRLSVDSMMSMLVFITMSFLGSSLNLMRQSIALSFIMMATIFAIRRKIIPFLFFIFLASTFHITAILGMIIYFIVGFRINKTTVILTAFLSGTLYFAFSPIYNFVVAHISAYSAYIENSSNNLLNIILNIIIAIVILLMSYFVLIRPEGKSASSTDQFMSVMVMIVIICEVVSLKFLMVNRISMYFNFIYILLIPKIVSSIKNYNFRAFVKMMVCSVLIGYFLMIQILRPEWSGMIPYVSIFNTALY